MVSADLDTLGPIVLLIGFIAFAVWMYMREGRNEVLENLVVMTDCNSRLVFRGTLAVEEHRAGAFLRLSKSTQETRRVQLWYRWFGVGRQAIFDEVTFDHARGVVELRRKDKRTAARLSEFSAIRMREVAQGRGSTSFWHIELIPHKGRARLFVSSVIGGRQASFAHTAPLAKAVSMIVGIPVQVVVAGNIWTPGWPPKGRSLANPPHS